VTGVEAWADGRRKRGWLEEEMRVGSGGGDGGRPGAWMEVEAELERKRLEGFLEEKAEGKSAELGNGGWRERREEWRRWREKMAQEAEGGRE